MEPQRSAEKWASDDGRAHDSVLVLETLEGPLHGVQLEESGKRV